MMRKLAAWVALILVSSAIIGCASSVNPQHLGPQSPPATFIVDPNAKPDSWGVYSRLVGHRYNPPTGGFPGFDIRWSEAGKVITETSLFLEGAIIGPDVKWSRTIRLGNKPGELNMDFQGTPWTGTIESDGSVVFQPVTPRSGDFPYRIRLSSNGEMLVQNLQWVNGSLSNVIYSTPYPVAVGSVATLTPPGTASLPTRPMTTSPPISTSFETSSESDKLAVGLAWLFLEKLVGTTWQEENSGGWDAHRKVISYTWTADKKNIEMKMGDGFKSTTIGTYRRDPTSGEVFADMTHDGRAVHPKVVATGEKSTTVNLDEDVKLIASMDASGSLVQTLQELTWRGNWETQSSTRYKKIDIDGRWGIFSRLAGFAWLDPEHQIGYDFVWNPDKKTFTVSKLYIGDPSSVDVISPREDKPNQFTSAIYDKEGSPAGEGLYILEEDLKVTRYTTDGYRYVFTLSEHDTLTVDMYKQKNNDWPKVDTSIYFRETRQRKDARLADLKQYAEARAARARTDQFYQASIAFSGALATANEIASNQEAKSRASLNETLARGAAQAQLEQIAQQDIKDHSNSDKSDPALSIRASEVTSSQPAKKQQAGTNKIYGPHIYLDTATNSMQSSTPQPTGKSTTNMAAGKVRLCNRPGDEGPAHWPICPEYVKAPGKANGAVAKNDGDVSTGASLVNGASGSKQGGGGRDESGGSSQGDADNGKSSSDGQQARAWCTQTTGGGFKCWGPMGKGSPWPDLQAALTYADCKGGEGNLPGVGKFTLFDCNHTLKGIAKPVPDSPPANW